MICQSSQPVSEYGYLKSSVIDSVWQARSRIRKLQMVQGGDAHKLRGLNCLLNDGRKGKEEKRNPMDREDAKLGGNIFLADVYRPRA
jgi:hypothetical protein